MLRALLLTLAAIVVVGGAVTWMFLRMKHERAVSAHDYVEQAKLEAQAEVQKMLRGRRPEK